MAGHIAPISSSTRAAGFWSAVLCAVFSIGYSVGQIAEWLGWMGSGGGAENASTPLGLVVLLTPSLLLGSAFLVLTVAINQLASAERKVWSLAAVAFATIYAVLVSINYFVQLTWVMPRLAAGRAQGIEQFLFTPFDSFLYSVDILGYSFMSVATLFAARCSPAAASSGWCVIPDRQRPAAAVHRVADVRPLADLDRGAVGGHVSWLRMVAGRAVSPSSGRQLNGLVESAM